MTGRRSRARAPVQDRPGRTRTGRTPLLLLTTTGHSTGRPRTVALLYLQRGAAFVVCSVDVRQELASPWVRNVRTHPDAVVEIGRRTVSVRARPATTGETEEWWPHLVLLWPAYRRLHERGGERSVYVLEPRDEGPDRPQD
ncbi:MAG: nitroreductase family deazaflavin-dependent oxidoreductase [Nocardioides sp.]|nr:nitroreductase family deazaflavin-dependent oxidoreductase [Nocardioidaceae bacterium]MCB8957786.1 nitroreductase family deazaflavin-dependent oxidoreductase [Nocardioides sp.]